MKHLTLGAIVKKCEEAIQLNPNDAEVHCNLGVACAELGRWERALGAFQDAIRLKPDYAQARRGLRAGLNVKQCAKTVRLKPDYAKAHCNLGVAYCELGRWEEALWTFKEAIRLKPDYAKAHCNLGVAYGELGRWEEALRAFKEAIRLKPDYAGAHCKLGVAYLALGNHGAALDQYRIVKSLDSGRTDRLFDSIRKYDSSLAAVAAGVR